MNGAPMVERPAALRFYRELFELLYGVPTPLLPLDRVLHWADIARLLGCAHLAINRAPTWVFGGYFFNTTSPIPDGEVIDAQMETGRAGGAQQFLVPTVRLSPSCEPLVARGFRPLPWFVECVYEVREDLDRDMRAQLGKKRHKEMLRLWRKAEQDYLTERYTAAELRADPSILAIVAQLHGHNVAKYNHALNFYSEEILERLLASPLGEHLLVCLRRDRETLEPVQTSISLVDRACGQMYQLVQGIARERVRAGHNLYIADTYDLYRFAESQGLTEINLGRGGAAHKRRLGANRTHLLMNWLRSDLPGAEAELDQLARRCRDVVQVPAGIAC
jgi:hypothetical protein